MRTISIVQLLQFIPSFSNAEIQAESEIGSDTISKIKQERVSADVSQI